MSGHLPFGDILEPFAQELDAQIEALSTAQALALDEAARSQAMRMLTDCFLAAGTHRGVEDAQAYATQLLGGGPATMFMGRQNNFYDEILPGPQLISDFTHGVFTSALVAYAEAVADVGPRAGATLADWPVDPEWVSLHTTESERSESDPGLLTGQSRQHKPDSELLTGRRHGRNQTYMKYLGKSRLTEFDDMFLPPAAEPAVRRLVLALQVFIYTDEIDLAVRLAGQGVEMLEAVLDPEQRQEWLRREAVKDNDLLCGHLVHDNEGLFGVKATEYINRILDASSFADKAWPFLSPMLFIPEISYRADWLAAKRFMAACSLAYSALSDVEEDEWETLMQGAADDPASVLTSMTTYTHSQLLEMQGNPLQLDQLEPHFTTNDERYDNDRRSWCRAMAQAWQAPLVGAQVGDIYEVRKAPYLHEPRMESPGQLESIFDPEVPARGKELKAQYKRLSAPSDRYSFLHQNRNTHDLAVQSSQALLSRITRLVELALDQEAWQQAGVPGPSGSKMRVQPMAALIGPIFVADDLVDGNFLPAGCLQAVIPLDQAVQVGYPLGVETSQVYVQLARTSEDLMDLFDNWLDPDAIVWCSTLPESATLTIVPRQLIWEELEDIAARVDLHVPEQPLPLELLQIQHRKACEHKAAHLVREIGMDYAKMVCCSDCGRQSIGGSVMDYEIGEPPTLAGYEAPAVDDEKGLNMVQWLAIQEHLRRLVCKEGGLDLRHLQLNRPAPESEIVRALAKEDHQRKLDQLNGVQAAPEPKIGDGLDHDLYESFTL